MQVNFWSLLVCCVTEQTVVTHIHSPSYSTYKRQILCQEVQYYSTALAQQSTYEKLTFTVSVTQMKGCKRWSYLTPLWLLVGIIPCSPLHKHLLLSWWKGNVLHSWVLCTTSLPSCESHINDEGTQKRSGSKHFGGSFIISSTDSPFRSQSFVRGCGCEDYLIHASSTHIAITQY